MKRIIKKDDLVDILSQKTGFFKKNMVEVVNALEDIILENMKMARIGEPSELHLAPGMYIGGKRKPEGPAKNPKTGEEVISPEKVIPYAQFNQSIRYKLYTDKRGYEKIRAKRDRRKKYAEKNSDK